MSKRSIRKLRHRGDHGTTRKTWCSVATNQRRNEALEREQDAAHEAYMRQGADDAPYR